MTQAHIEVFVEPFKENDPGPHVRASVDAISAAGLEPDMGPFATSASGELGDILRAADEVLRQSFESGATAVQLRIEKS